MQLLIIIRGMPTVEVLSEILACQHAFGIPANREALRAGSLLLRPMHALMPSHGLSSILHVMACADSNKGPCACAQMLERLLDRSHLEQHRPPPYALTGVGYEVVNHAEGSGLLSGVE
jgi:hypothetical protein